MTNGAWLPRPTLGLAALLSFGCAEHTSSVPAAAPSPAASAAVARVPSRFAAHAPAHTRALLSFDARSSPFTPELAVLAPLVPDCDLHAKGAIERVDVAIAEPAELRVDLRGSLSVETAQCVLDSLARRQALGGLELRALPLDGGGVRIVTPGAAADGPGGAATLTRRFEALSTRSGFVLVSDIGPGGGLCQLSAENGGEARIELTTAAQATDAQAWLSRAAQASKDPRLHAVSAKAHARELVIRLPDPDPLLASALKREVMEAFRLPSASMQPTLVPGDQLLVLKPEHDRLPERGDIVVFASPRDPSQVFVKRVVGVAGDRVQIDAHQVRVNGSALETALESESYTAPGDDAPSGQIWRESVGTHHYRILRDDSRRAPEQLEVEVPPKSLFVLGDNRESSFDSRQFGSVPLALLRGRLVIVWASFSERGPRWERFGVEPD